MPPRSNSRKRLLAAQRGAATRASWCRLGQEQRAVREIERGEAELARHGFAPAGLPAKAAGDHQVNHQEEIALELEHDALADAGARPHLFAERAREGGEKVRRRNGLFSRTAAKLLARDPAREVLDVDRYVRQLGHGGPFIGNC